VGGFVVLIPLMVASTVSYLVSWNHSLYESQITSSRMGVDFSTLSEVEVKDVMSKDLKSIDMAMLPRELLTLIKEHPHHLYPVVQGGHLAGIVTRESILQRQDQDFIVSDIIQTNFHSIQQTKSAAEAFEIMASKNVSMVVVVDSEEANGLVGVVTRIDIFTAMEHMDERHHAF